MNNRSSSTSSRPGAALFAVVGLTVIGCAAPPPLTPLPDAGIEAVDAGRVDAGAVADAGPADAGLASLCTVTDDEVECPVSTRSVAALAGAPRDVHYQLPRGTPPPGGWPVVLMFQGSFAPSKLCFRSTKEAALGFYFQALTVARLLEAGYAVLAPEAHLGGTRYWDTNVLPWAAAWQGSPDDVFMNAIFAAIADGSFGPLSTQQWYAVGISSGGYMTSRMAVSYPGRFQALAVHSASYATCGPICTVPALPADHPPTLLLHGERDNVAPLWAMELYRDALADAGVPARTVVDPSCGHEWLPGAPAEVLGWFGAH